MKNLAKLVLFFSLSFAVLFLVSAGIRFLALRVEWLRHVPQQPETVLPALIAAAHWALSLALYGSLLLSLSYIARGRYFVPLSIVCLFVLSVVFSFGISLGLDRWGYVAPAQNQPRLLGEPGLILANNLSSSDTAVVLLNGPTEADGPRVVATPDRALVFQEQAPSLSPTSLPPVPFRDESPWFLKSLAIDIRLSGQQMQQRYSEGIFPFLIYTGALIFFLSSLGFILKLSAWPLANLFLGCLAFRGILALETFFNTPEMQDVFASFLKDRLPSELAVPLIFCGFGLLVHIYSILVYAAKRRKDEED